MEYTFISVSDDERHFQDLVNVRLSEGWQLQGGESVSIAYAVTTVW